MLAGEEAQVAALLLEEGEGAGDGGADGERTWMVLLSALPVTMS